MIVEIWVRRSCVRVSQVFVLSLCPPGWRLVQLVQRICRRFGKGLAGKECGFFWKRGMLWACARQQASGMSRRSMGHSPSSSSALSVRSQQAARELWVSDTEDVMSSSEEEGEHNVDNFMLCSVAHHACSPLLQESLHEVELRKVALTCHCSLGVVYLCQK